MIKVGRAEFATGVVFIGLAWLLGFAACLAIYG